MLIGHEVFQHTSQNKKLINLTKISCYRIMVSSPPFIQSEMTDQTIPYDDQLGVKKFDSSIISQGGNTGSIPVGMTKCPLSIKVITHDL